MGNHGNISAALSMDGIITTHVSETTIDRSKDTITSHSIEFDSLNGEETIMVPEIAELMVVGLPSQL